MRKLHTIVILITYIVTSACSTASRTMNQSPNFRDNKFHNTEHKSDKSFWTFLRMRMNTKWSQWPEWIDYSIPKFQESNEITQTLRVTFINHASFLLQTVGINILTDPIYSNRCSPISFIGPKRVHAPGIKIEELPKIDFVIISHDHYDHLDLPTIEQIVKRDNPKVFVGLGLKQRLPASADVIEMDWWQMYEASTKLKVHFVEVQHFSGRSLWDRNSTLWGGFVLEFENKKVYFGGDSGYATHYKRTFEKYGKMDLSLLPIGAYAPRDFMGPMHVDPKQAVQAHLDLNSLKSIGMHFGTFQLTAEPINEPARLLENESSLAGLKKDEFVILKPGEVLEIK